MNLDTVAAVIIHYTVAVFCAIVLWHISPGLVAICFLLLMALVAGQKKPSTRALATKVRAMRKLQQADQNDCCRKASEREVDQLLTDVLGADQTTLSTNQHGKPA